MSNIARYDPKYCSVLSSKIHFEAVSNGFIKYVKSHSAEQSARADRGSLFVNRVVSRHARDAAQQYSGRMAITSTVEK